MQLFNPFQPISFKENICFLTGNHLSENEIHTIPVFPEWLISRYKLEEASITMIDNHKMKYKNIQLPACKEVANAINKLDFDTKTAFEAGYDAVIKLPEITLFQWMARTLYGVLFQDFVFAIKYHQEKEKEFKTSELMQLKITYLLGMLQSLIRPVEFINFKPWSIQCYRVNISKDILNYKDETHHFNFCLGMNGFGIIACLQDNGTVTHYNKEVLNKVGNAVLHPVQFEELYGRFLYSNYLLKDTTNYQINDKNGIIQYQLPATELENTGTFATWDDKVFAQVLSNLWQPWGIPFNKVYNFPNSPMSYLIDERTLAFIPKEQIGLPF